jgi:CHAD domain-containing protein
VPSWAEPLGEELKWLGRAVGPARDLDVLIEHLTAELARLGGDDAAAGALVLDELNRRRSEAMDVVLDTLASDRYLLLLDRLEEPPVLRGKASRSALAAVAARESRKLAKAGRTIGPDSSDEALHALRIRLKRARYAAELAEPNGQKAIGRFLDHAKELQDVLGANQDTVVAEKWLRSLSLVDGAPTGVAVGRLIERQHQRRKAVRSSLPATWKATVRSSRRALA